MGGRGVIFSKLYVVYSATITISSFSRSLLSFTGRKSWRVPCSHFTAHQMWKFDTYHFDQSICIQRVLKLKFHKGILGKTLILTNGNVRSWSYNVRLIDELCIDCCTRSKKIISTFFSFWHLPFLLFFPGLDTTPFQNIQFDEDFIIIFMYSDLSCIKCYSIRA